MVAPVYVRHEIVHNKRVVDGLRAKGARFVEEVEDVPQGAVTVFSAHGVARKVVEDAGVRGLRAIDATCPLVSKVHNEARRYARKGYEVVLIGHPGHPEVEGTMGQVPGEGPPGIGPGRRGDAGPRRSGEAGLCDANDPQRRRYPRDHRGAREALPGDQGPDVKDICYATQIGRLRCGGSRIVPT